MVGTTTDASSGSGPKQQQSLHRHDDLEGCAWPDPDPSPPSSRSRQGQQLSVDDVSRMSETPVAEIAFPRNERDVRDVLADAVRRRLRVCARGTQHSMGGHAACRGGVVVDTRYLSSMEYRAESSTVTVGAGCRWSDVIQFLNTFGKSPRTMQSYASFSVGGTVAVNAHGITSDTPLSADVVQFRLARYVRRKQGDDTGDGDGDDSNICVRIDECSPPADPITATKCESEELFGLVLGGYGLFGIVTQVTLKVADNAELVMDSMQLRLQPNNPRTAANGNDSDDTRGADEEKEDPEFVRIWKACQATGCKNDVQVKLARLNILTLETASLYVFRRCCHDCSTANTASGGVVSSNLPLHPKELSKTSQLLYKWTLPILKEYRQDREERTGQATDMQRQQYGITKNELLYESAVPLAKLYSPLIVVNDSFVLQEFFVPQKNFSAWIQAVRPIYQEIHAYQKSGVNKHRPSGVKEENPSLKIDDNREGQNLMLLNTTIRYVEYDKYSFLKYGAARGGMFAFVLYYRAKRTADIEAKLGYFHNRFAQESIKLNGTFYLPYRKCYSSNMLERAYPNIESFARLKEKYDFLGVFSNEWFEKYLLHMCTNEYRARWLGDLVGQPLAVYQSPPSTCTVSPDDPTHSQEESTPYLPGCSLRRTGSYRSLLGNRRLRQQFLEEFLVNIFNVEEPTEVMRAITKAAWDSANKDDDDIYRAVYEHFHCSTSEIFTVSTMRKGWRSLRQLSHQKRELTRELSLVLHRLGLFGRIRGYASIGDHGKIVLNLRRAGVFAPCLGGDDNTVYVIHDFKKDDELSLPCILERGSMQAVGNQIPYDYMRDDAASKIGQVPANAVDMVTINQGLHHIPPTKLFGFLTEVIRILRDGGVFVIREHDLDINGARETERRNNLLAPVEILDIAHSVFNAVTGVPPEVDKEEIRAFRPVNEWREILEKFGFSFVHLFGVESGDPTQDIMLFFRKGPACKHSISTPPPSISEDVLIKEPAFAATVRALLSQVPSSVVSVVDSMLKWLKTFLPVLANAIPRSSGSGDGFLVVTDKDSANERQMKMALDFFGNWFAGSLSQLSEFVSGAQDLLRDIQIRETVDLAGLLSMPELFLIMPALKRRADETPDLISDLEKQFLDAVRICLPSLFLCETPPGSESAAPASQQIPTPAADDVVSAVSPVDVKEVLTLVGEKVPGILDPETFLPSSEFTLTQQSALIGFFAASDIDAVAKKVVHYCDVASWNEVKYALVGNEATALLGSSDTVVLRGELPTRTRLLSPLLNHPWRLSLKAFLKSPRIRITQQTLVGMKFIGLHDFISLYNEAKSEADTNPVLTSKSVMSVGDTMALRDLIAAAVNSTDIKEISITFDDNRSSHDLYDVGTIVKAEFGYQSLTSRLTDISAALYDFHMQIQTARVGPNASGTFDGNGRKPAAGWLPLRLNVLNGFRNQNQAAQISDSLRQAVVGIGSLGLAGQNVLKLKYRPFRTQVSAEETRACEVICSFLQRRSLINGSIHGSDDGHFKWFKLAEWLLVDITEKLGSSLDHTPWYFFPFMECLRLYFDVLFKECKVVADEFGFAKAFASEAFLTDLVPGLVMAIVFGQMKAMSIPLASFFPLSTDADDIMVEEVVFLATVPAGPEDTFTSSDDLTAYFQSLVDKRIHSTSLLAQHNGLNGLALCKATVPTYKAMGEILMQLALSVPSARVLQISGHKVVQARITIDLQCQKRDRQLFCETSKKQLQEIDGVTILFEYQFPNDNQLMKLKLGCLLEDKVHLAVCVNVLSLLHLARTVAAMDGVQLEQVYELWNGWQ